MQDTCDRRAVCAHAMKRPAVVAVVLTFTLVLGLATAAAAPHASNVYSVWDANISCGAPAAIATSRHPEEAALKATGKVGIGGTGYSLAVPQLPGGTDSVVLLVTDDRSRGVVDHYLLLAHGDYSPPVAAVVLTELPDTMLGEAPEDILRSQARAQLGNGRSAPALAPTFNDHFENGQPVLEMLVPGRSGSTCFPTAHFVQAPPGQEPTLGISRFTVEGRYLVEISLIVPATAGGADGIADARAHMARFDAALSRPAAQP